MAPILWFDHVSQPFKELGFKQSTYDPCLLYTDNMLVVLYVNDAGIAAKNPSNIDKLIDMLQQKGFDLMREGSFTEFLVSSSSKLTRTNTDLPSAVSLTRLSQPPASKTVSLTFFLALSKLSALILKARR